jgi:hypothetical protein
MTIETSSDGLPRLNYQGFGTHRAGRLLRFDQAPRAFDEVKTSSELRGGLVKTLANPGPIA